jgi:hypothetical protein
MAEKQEPYTERDFSELSRKLKTLGKDLTPKESAFLTDVVESSRKAASGGEVRGFGGQYDAKGYTPGAAGSPEAGMDTSQIRIAIKGTFVSQ